MSPTWVLISGPKGVSRAATLDALIDGLRARGLRVGGFVQESIAPTAGDEPRAGYRARRLSGDATVALARRGAGAAAEVVCGYAFDPDGLAAVAGWIADDAAACDVLVIGAVNRLEAAGAGHAAAIERALASGRPTVLAVHASRVLAILERFGLDEPVAALEVTGPEVAPGVDAVVARLAGV